MKRKATLIIQHLERIYTMVPPHFPCIEHGFLAIHHEEIIALGEGEGWEHVDKDTRILEGRGHIAIPGMIDVSMQLPCTYKLAKNTNMVHTYSELLRYTRENCEVLMRHGTLVGNLDGTVSETESKLVEQFYRPYDFDFLHKEISVRYPIVKPLVKEVKKCYQRFCISCGYGNVNCYDQFLCAKLYYRASGNAAMQVLAACTIYPAMALGLPRVGSLAKGKLANILVMEGTDMEDVFHCFHGDERMHVIKEGTRIIPNVII